MQTTNDFTVYSEQVEQLVQMGFDKPKKNAWILSRVNGDVAKAVEILEKHRAKKEKRDEKRGFCKGDSSNETDFSEQVEQLVQMGFDKPKKNAWILSRANGDVSKAVEILEKHRAKKEKRDEKWGFCKGDSSNETNFDEQVEKLVSMGFPQKRRNIWILRRVNGDVTKAAEILEKRQAKWRKWAKWSQERTASEMKLEKIEKSLDDLTLENPKAPESSEASPSENLNEEFFSDRQSAHLLAKTGGNLEVVREFLSAREKLRAAIHDHQKERKRKCRSAWQQRKAKRNSEEKKEFEGEEGKMETETSSSLDFIPQDATRIFLDGSNIIYQLGPLRKLALKGREIHKAESILEGLARKLTDISGIPSCVLFDETSRSVQEEKFVVESSSPSFPHSGKALLSKVEGERHPVVITADDQLEQELAQRGVTIVKPKFWLSDVAHLVEPNRFFRNKRDVKSFLKEEIDRH